MGCQTFATISGLIVTVTSFFVGARTWKMLGGIVFRSENVPKISASEKVITLSGALWKDLNAAELSSILEAGK